MTTQTQNREQFKPLVSFIDAAKAAFSAKVLYVRNAKGDEKGKEVKLILGENLLSHLKK